VLLFPVAGLLLLGLTVRALRRGRRAYTCGEPVLATVTSAGFDRKTRINGKNPFKVAWEFQVAGDSFKGSLSAMDPAALAAFADQREVVVLYDPAGPAANMLWIP
jgi:hypothetical protein